ncbi:hypothetical protein PG2115B_0161 [Bifidobacterium pseudolongum subsp. globosum]|nr:hypothetical protein PG2115B_0161 [Bifidobacterium pseudolongum subsp. globosum]
MNPTTNTSSHCEALPSEALNDDYTMSCLASKDEMNTLGHTVTLCGKRIGRHDGRFTGRGASSVVACPICCAVLHDPLFKNELRAYGERHVKPYLRGEI